MPMIRLCVFIPARNEEKWIGQTLKALKNQTLKPYKIIVVNDGSTDRTSEIAQEIGCCVINLPNRGYGAIGHPELALVHNVGLKKCREFNPEYVMVVGADHILPINYIEQLIEKMEFYNPKLVIASGSIQGEYRVQSHPCGSGRIMKVKFLDQVHWHYPFIYGWESYFTYKAMSLGYATRHFDAINSHARRTFIMFAHGKKSIFYGRTMKTLGYFTLYFLARVFLLFLKRPLAAIYMFYGYFIETEKSEVVEFVNKWQRKHFWRHFIMRLRQKIHW